MKIFLIRHGQTTGDLEDRYGGDYDDHLTEVGRTQATDLAEKLINKGIEKIFASPLIRAQETAEIINQKLSVSTETFEDLRERNQYGILTGMVKSEAKEKYPKEVELLKDYRNTITGAESYTDFSERFGKSLEKIFGSNFQSVAIITHGSGPIKYIFREVLKEGEVKVEDCGFAELNYTDGKLSLVSLSGIKIVR